MKMWVDLDAENLMALLEHYRSAISNNSSYPHPGELEAKVIQLPCALALIPWTRGVKNMHSPVPLPSVQTCKN